MIFLCLAALFFAIEAVRINPKDASSLAQLRAYSLTACEGSSTAASSAACMLARYVAMAEQAGYLDLGTAASRLYQGKQNNDQAIMYLQSIPQTTLNTALGSTLPMALNALVSALSPAVSNFYYSTNQSDSQTKSMVTTMDLRFNQTLAALYTLFTSALNGESANDIASANTLIRAANALNLNSSTTPVFSNLATFLTQIPSGLTSKISDVRKADNQVRDLLVTLPVSLSAATAFFGTNLTQVNTKASTSLTTLLANIRSGAKTRYTAMADSANAVLPSAKTGVADQSTLWTNARIADLATKTQGASALIKGILTGMSQLNATVQSTSSSVGASIDLGKNATLNSTRLINQALTAKMVDMNSLIRTASISPAEAWDRTADTRVSELSSALDAARAKISQDLASGASTGNVANSLLNSMSAIGNIQKTIDDKLANESRASVDAMNNLTRLMLNDTSNTAQLFALINRFRNEMGSNLSGNITSASMASTARILATLDSIHAQTGIATEKTNQAVSAVNNMFMNTSTQVDNVMKSYEQIVQANVTSAARNSSSIQTTVSVSTDGAKRGLDELIARITSIASNISLQGNGALATNQITLASLASIDSQTSDGIDQLMEAIAQKQADLDKLFASVQTAAGAKLVSGLGSVVVPNLAGDAAESISDFKSSQNDSSIEVQTALRKVVDAVDSKTASVRYQAGLLVSDATKFAAMNTSDYLTPFANSLRSLLSDFNSSLVNSAIGYKESGLSGPVDTQLATWTTVDVLQALTALQTRLQILKTSLSTNDMAMGALSGSLKDQLAAVNLTQGNDIAMIQTLIGSANNIDGYLKDEATALRDALTVQNASVWKRMDITNLLSLNVSALTATRIACWRTNYTALNSSVVSDLTLWPAESVADARQQSILPSAVTGYKDSADRLVNNETKFLSDITSASKKVLDTLTSQLDTLSTSVNASLPGWNAQADTLRTTLKTVAQSIDASVADAAANSQNMIVPLTGQSVSNAEKLQSATTAAMNAAANSLYQGVDASRSLGDVLIDNLAARQNMLGTVVNQLGSTNSLIDGILSEALRNVSDSSPTFNTDGSNISLSDISNSVQAYLTFSQAMVSSLPHIDLGSAATDVQRKLDGASGDALAANVWVRVAIDSLAAKDSDLNDLVDKVQSDSVTLKSDLEAVAFPTEVGAESISQQIRPYAQVVTDETNSLSSLDTRIADMIARASV